MSSPARQGSGTTPREGRDGGWSSVSLVMVVYVRTLFADWEEDVDFVEAASSVLFFFSSVVVNDCECGGGGIIEACDTRLGVTTVGVTLYAKVFGG